MYFEEKPSNIRFSQDSIAGCWKIENTPIGDTLDKLLLDKIDINDIPKITVHSIGGHYYSADNRRLWVFQKLETLGKCEKIKVEYNRRKINPKKFTTKNNGVSIQIRGTRGPGGRFWKQWKNSNPLRDEAIEGSGKQSDLMQNPATCDQNTMDHSKFTLGLSSLKIEEEIEARVEAKDIWYFQRRVVADGKILGDMLDLWLSYDGTRPCELKVFEIGKRYFTADCTTLWVLKTLEKFGRSPEIRLTVTDSPIQKNDYFFRQSLVFTADLQIGGSAWKDIEFLKNLSTLKSIKTEVDDIYFTRASISDTYENKSIAKVLMECNDTITIPRFPRVVKFKDRYYALDNEILWLSKEVQKLQGPLSLNVKVKIEMDDILFNSFTSDNLNEVKIKPSGFKHTTGEALILQYIKERNVERKRESMDR